MRILSTLVLGVVGFWKTTNGGGEWTGNSTDFLPATGVNTFSVKPDNPNHILINLRNARNGYSHGVYRSTDGGTTFSETLFNPQTLGVGGLDLLLKFTKLRIIL